jgi:hypothetical protein
MEIIGPKAGSVKTYIALQQFFSQSRKTVFPACPRAVVPKFAIPAIAASVQTSESGH